MGTSQHSQRLPVIDLAALSEGAAAEREVVDQLDAACRDFGFFYLLGHGIDAALIDELMHLSRVFFDEDIEQKRAIHMSKGGRAWRGYFAVGDELTSGAPDRKEGLYLGIELDASDPRVQRGLPLHGPNQFPALPGFRSAVLDYMTAVTGLAHRVLALLSIGLGLDASYLHERYSADPTVLFRIFNYPAADASAHAGSGWGVGEHTDYGLLTLLKQDSVGGLQVRHGEGWIDVPDLPGSFVCNVGDMLERFTRGRYLSALHRARNSSNLNRLSMALFFDPSFDALLAPIEELPSRADAPHTQVRWDHLDPHAVNGTYGEYLLAKVSKVFPGLRDEVL